MVEDNTDKDETARDASVIPISVWTDGIYSDIFPHLLHLPLCCSKPERPVTKPKNGVTLRSAYNTSMRGALVKAVID